MYCLEMQIGADVVPTYLYYAVGVDIGNGN